MPADRVVVWQRSSNRQTVNKGEPMSSTLRKATNSQVSDGAQSALSDAIAALEPYDDEDLIDGAISKLQTLMTAEMPDPNQPINQGAGAISKSERREMRLAAVAKVEADMAREGLLTPQVQADLRKASEDAQLAALRERNPKAAEIWQQNNAGRMGR
jgi:hypothetical protein